MWSFRQVSGHFSPSVRSKICHDSKAKVCLYLVTISLVLALLADHQRSGCPPSNLDWHCIPNYRDDKCVAVQRRSSHSILANIKPGENLIDGRDAGVHVILTTITDFRHLAYLPILVERWNGPISLAVYAPGWDLDLMLDELEFLLHCSNASHLINKWVSFHLVLLTRLESDLPHDWKRSGTSGNCAQRPRLESRNWPSYREARGLEFPINLLRNTAIESIESDHPNVFIFPCDIELVPNGGLADKFKQWVQDEPSRESQSSGPVIRALSDRLAFLVPEFELQAGEWLPENKRDVLQGLTNKPKTIVIFHSKTAGSLHRIPSMKEWISTPETNDSNLEILPTIHAAPRGRWEPLFIIRKAIMPPFDERLTWEGRSDKVVLMRKMCLLGFHFATINNAFAIHRGIKFRDQVAPAHALKIRRQSSTIRDIIMPEYRALNAGGRRYNCT